MTSDHVIATGFSFPEGPCFDQEGVLHVVELAAGCVSRVVGGKRIVLAELGGSPNGAAFGRDGFLYVCNNGGYWPAAASTGYRHGLGGGPGLIQRVGPDGSFATVIAEIGGAPLNSPNDICFDDHGGFYFTDPKWAPRREDLSLDMGVLSPGSVCYGAPSGEAVRIDTEILFPNGLSVTDNGSSLIVDETGTGRIFRFPILDPGCLGEPELYADLGPDATPDGMCFDQDERLYVAGHGSNSVYVVAAGGGVVEEVISFEDAEITNVCFGGPDYCVLFVTQAVHGRVVSVNRRVPGMYLFPDRTAR
jgi:gluconolactonase